MKPGNISSFFRTLVIPAVLITTIAGWYLVRTPNTSEQATATPAAGRSLQTKTGHRDLPDRTKETRRHEAISAAAQKWYEELLEIYPDMKPEYRDVPDSENGFLHLLLLAEAHNGTKLTAEIEELFHGSEKWDSEKFAAWLADNKDYHDEILRIAELPDQSSKGIDFDRFSTGARWLSEFGKLLNGCARIAFEKGDQVSALRYSQAAISLSDHLTNIEAPSMLGQVIAQGYRCHTRDLFLEEILPVLSNDPQSLQTWREALFKTNDTAADYKHLLAGEWSFFIRSQILPAMLGEHSIEIGALSFDIPDPDTYFQYYTEAIRKLATGFTDSGPGRLDLSRTELEFPESGIDAQTLHMLRETSKAYQGIFRALGNRVTRDEMISAAISIQLGEDPGVDPVSGEPFKWDSISQVISFPSGDHDSISIKSR